MASRFTRNVISEAPLDKKFNWNTQVNDLLNDGIDLFYHDKDDKIRQLSQNREVADLYRITTQNRKDIDKNRQDIDNLMIGGGSGGSVNLSNYYTKKEVDNLIADLTNKINELEATLLELSDSTRNDIIKIVE